MEHDPQKACSWSSDTVPHPRTPFHMCVCVCVRACVDTLEQRTVGRSSAWQDLCSARAMAGSCSLSESTIAHTHTCKTLTLTNPSPPPRSLAVVSRLGSWSPFPSPLPKRETVNISTARTQEQGYALRRDGNFRHGKYTNVIFLLLSLLVLLSLSFWVGGSGVVVSQTTC